jgi:hypothetical protein
MLNELGQEDSLERRVKIILKTENKKTLPEQTPFLLG